MKFTVYYLKNDAMVKAYTLNIENVNPSDYTKVGCVEARNLEDLFRRMNCVDGSEYEYVGRGKMEVRSLSVGDVALLEDGGAYLCASVGWDVISRKGFES